MNRVLHRIIAAVVILGFATTTLADETKPILVMSLKGHQNLIEDLEYVGSTAAFDPAEGEAAGKRFVKGTMNSFVKKLFDLDQIDIREMPGIDGERPWGMTVLTDEVNIVPLAFLPVTDLDAYLEFVKKYNGDRVNETEDGLYEINLTDTETMFLKLDGDWAFIGQGPHNLETLPNPDEILGDLPSQHDAGMRITFEEFPAFLRDMLLDSSDRLGDVVPIDGLNSMLGMLGDDPGEALSILLTQIREVTIGMSIDAESHSASFEMNVIPVEGSGAANEFAALGEGTSRFGTLIEDDSAFMMHVTIDQMTPGMIDMAHQAVEDYHAQVTTVIETTEKTDQDREREIFGEILASFTSILSDTIDTGKVDMAMRMSGSATKFTMVGGTTIADHEPVDAMIKRIAELSDGDPGIESVTLDVAEQDGVAIHAFKFASKAGQEASTGASMMATLFGDSAQMYVAVSEDAFMFSFGVDGLEQLKAAIAPSEKVVPPMEMVMELKSLFELASGSVGDNQQMQMAMGIMKMQMALVDSHTKLSVAPSSDGLTVKGEAKEGIMKLVAVSLPLLQDLIVDQIKSATGGLGLPVLSN